MFSHSEMFCLRAAEGWLELGNSAEAANELAGISSENQSHPDVLQLRWQIFSKEKRWEDAVATARRICELAPNWEFGWIHLPYALHELGRTQEAYDSLCPVLDKFPTDWLMRYNMACYACQLGKLEEARGWLARASALGDETEIKQMAETDRDLEPLRS